MTEDKKENQKVKEEVVFPFIEGEKISLVVQVSKFIPLIVRWNNDPEIRHYAR